MTQYLKKYINNCYCLRQLRLFEFIRKTLHLKEKLDRKKSSRPKKFRKMKYYCHFWASIHNNYAEFCFDNLKNERC
jgi:hypothetical protein